MTSAEGVLEVRTAGVVRGARRADWWSSAGSVGRTPGGEARFQAPRPVRGWDATGGVRLWAPGPAGVNLARAARRRTPVARRRRLADGQRLDARPRPGRPAGR